MPQFDQQSNRRISKTVRGWERRKRNERARRARYTDKRAPMVEFELLEDLDQWSGAVVRAARRKWDPSANGGNGGYFVDCDDIIYVADYNEVGHNASAGGYGMAQMRGRDNEPRWVGVIFDLCCPGDEQGECGGSGS